MQIKKRYFVVALVLLLGLTTFSFANPKEEMGSKKTAKGISETVTNDIKENNSYSEALEAVEVAEENPTEETVEAARNEIRNANDAPEEQVQNLQQRVDVVEETIDVAALVKEVETLAEVKETREQAKSKYPNAETEVNKLDEGNVKDNLEKRLTKVSRLLNDKEAPEIKGVNEKVPTKNNVTINVSDEFLASVKVNDKEYTAEDFTTENDLLKLTAEESEEGEYTVVATDKLGNSVAKTFTIDKTAPGRVYSTVRVNKTEYEENKVKYYYVKNGDSFVFAMQFTEELAETPTVKIAGRNVEMKLNEDVLKKENKYIYEGTFAIPTNEKELKQGNLEIKLSNVKDLAGNEAISPIVLDQTKTSNSRTVIYDCKNPVIAGVNNNRVYTEGIKITEVDYIVHNVSPIASATIDGEEYVLGTEYKKEGKHQFIAYDRAGNRVRVNFEIDTKAPANSYVAVLSKADNYKYAKNGDVIRFLVAFNEEVKLTEKFTVTFNNKTKALVRSGDKTKWEYIAEFKIPEKEETLKEGLLTFEVKGFEDIHGNASEEVLKIGSHYKYNEVTYDRTAPVFVEETGYNENGINPYIKLADKNDISFKVYRKGTEKPIHEFDSTTVAKSFKIGWHGGGFYTIVATDAAGNTTSKEFEVYHVIDSIDDLKNVFKNGSKAILTKNITLDTAVEVAEGKKLEIDLNGYELKISNPEKSSTRLINNKGDLSIKNGSLINEKIHAYGIVDNYGTLTIDNIEVRDNGSFDGSTIKNRNGKVKITNSKFNITSSVGYKTDEKEKNVKFGNAAVWSDGELVIKNTNINSDSERAYSLIVNNGKSIIENVNAKGKHGGLAATGGTVTINDMKYESDVHYGIYVSNKSEANVTINGGEFIGQLQGLLVYNEYDKADVKVTVNGGTFSSKTGKEAAKVSKGNKELTHKMELIIKGGTFVNTELPEEYIVDGYRQNAEGRVVKENAISTKAEMVSAITEGGKFELDTNLILTDESLTVAKGKDVEINLNGKTITGRSTAKTTTKLIEVASGANLKLTGKGTIEFTAGSPDTDWGEGGAKPYPGYASNTISNRGNLVVDGPTIINNTGKGGASYVIDNYEGSNLTVESGLIHQVGGDQAIRLFSGSTTKAVNVTINGGEIKGYRAIWVHITGNDFSKAPLTNLTINGGTLSTTVEDGTALYSYSYGNSFKNTNITITGGTFNGHVDFGGGKNKEDIENVTITGGTFNGELGRWVTAEDYVNIDKPTK